MSSNFFDKVYFVTRQIPYGRVTSYGAIARFIGSPQSSRMVGYALNGAASQQNFVPAHRVVNRNGLLTGKKYFGGQNTMKELLENEGAIIKDNKIINFKDIFWYPSIELKHILHMEKLIFATNNNHKLTEVKQILNGIFEVTGLKEAGIDEDIPENEITLEGNARAKAVYVYNKLKTNVFADDTGLEIEALNNEPGVYSARYAGENKNSQDNMNKVLQEMQNISNRKARFRTAICLILNNTEYTFEGIVNGTILKKPVGNAGFGYDPIFQPEGYNISFAQMDAAEKNKISHRGKAIEQLMNFLLKK